MTQNATLPLVLLHGATSDPGVWDAQVAHFSATRTVIAVDLTSFDSVENMAQHVLETTPPSFVLCGTSMGGYAALAVLRADKARVKRVIFCNTGARADTEEKKRQRRIEVAAGEEKYFETRKDDSHYALFLGTRAATDKALVAKLRAVAHRVGYDCFRRHQTACMNRPDSVPLLSTVDIPALIIGGDEDRITPPELQQEMRALLPQATLKMFPGVGHTAHMEETAAFNAEIETFLANS